MTVTHDVAVIGNYVGGRTIDSPQTFAKFSPVTAELVATVSEADQEVVDRAVDAARRALPGPWGTMTVAKRHRVLHAVADELDRRFDELVAAEVRDTGKPLAQARTLDVPRAAANFRAFADMIKGIGVEAYRSDFADGTRGLNYGVRKPMGVVAIVVPWNLPLLLATWKIAPALACGNTVVVKPSEETPSSIMVVADAMRAAGVPDGVFNVVHGFGPGSAGEMLVRHEGIDAITFTGESSTGSAIMRSAADHVRAVSFELGGKNAGIVFADADLDAAIAGTVRSTFTNGGQVCLCTERILVERPVFDEFVERFVEKSSRLAFGWPDSADTAMMPMISSSHRDKVLRYYELARTEGATLLTGGGCPIFDDARDNGNYVEPTVAVGLANSARTNQEEVFGPFCHIAPFDAEDEAIAAANDSEYGLAATVWTEDVRRAHRVAPAIDAGLVWVNGWYQRDLRTPFGGVKASGIGREGGIHSLDFYSEVSNVCLVL